LDFRAFSLVARGVRLTMRYLWTAVAGQTVEQILMKDKAEDAKQDRAADTDVHPTEAPAAIAATIVAPVLNVVADAAGCPPHALFFLASGCNYRTVPCKEGSGGATAVPERVTIVLTSRQAIALHS